jgi:signal transduction histidine kinase
LIDVRSTDLLGNMKPPARDTLIFGLGLALVLFVITRAQIAAWHTAVRHEAELSASAEALRESEGRLREMMTLEREARARAESADRAKDDFLAMVSHEVRTPLNVVLGCLSVLRNGALPGERQAHALEVVERNARLQSKLIGDLLDVSRIMRGQIALELRPVDVTSVITAVLDELRPAADDKGVDLHGPEVGMPITLSADGDRLRQIVWNLVSNAIKFTPSGGSVHVDLTGGDEYVELSVRDTGIGIPPEFLPHVFERFRQADTTMTRTHPGLGLGLSIVHDLVKLHEGTIEARSEGKNRGSVFVVRLPVDADCRVTPIDSVDLEPTVHKA